MEVEAHFTTHQMGVLHSHKQISLVMCILNIFKVSYNQYDMYFRYYIVLHPLNSGWFAAISANVCVNRLRGDRNITLFVVRDKCGTQQIHKVLVYLELLLLERFFGVIILTRMQ